VKIPRIFELIPQIPTDILLQPAYQNRGNHLPGKHEKPRKVRKFQSGREKVRENEKVGETV